MGGSTIVLSPFDISNAINTIETIFLFYAFILKCQKNEKLAQICNTMSLNPNSPNFKTTFELTSFKRWMMVKYNM
jgi:hypothetical protein